MSSPRPALAALALTAALSTPALGQVRALYTGLAGDDTNNVPGQPGAGFNDTTGSQTTFDRPFLSPDGTLVGFKGDIEVSGTFFDDVIVVTPLNNPAAAYSVREGFAVPGVTDGSLSVAFDARVSLLNNGDFAFTGQRRVGNTTQGNDLVYRYDASTASLSVAATAGDSFGGSTLDGGGINSPYLSPTGGIGLQGLLASPGQAVVFGPNLLAAEGQTPAGAPAATDTFEFQTTFFGNNGQSYLTQARSFPPGRTVDTTIVNGQSVLIGGQAIPNSSLSAALTDTGPAFAALNEAGTWFARGVLVDDTEFTIVDGEVYAVEGDAILDGSAGETWTAFDGISVDALGNVAVVGETTAGGSAAVLNNELVLARTGEAVDLDGDGLFDDDLFIRDFSVDDAVLSQTGQFVFAARLQNAAGSARGQALLVVPVPEPTGLATLGLAGLALLRRRR